MTNDQYVICHITHHNSLTHVYAKLIAVFRQCVLISAEFQRLVMATTRPHRDEHFEEIGSEEAHTIETFERVVGGTPYSEPHRQYSTKQFTERRTFGRDENGEIIVRIDKNPSQPIRPADPVRPVTPVEEYRYEHLLKPIQPLSIPRIDIRSASPSQSPHQRSKSTRIQYDTSTVRSPSSSPRNVKLSPCSTSGSGSNNTRMRKIITKSRLVSIHDGRPVAPCSETVTYEPIFPHRCSRSSSTSLLPYTRNESEESCAYLIQNPLYRNQH
ncbi:hypothetical protein DICVIV_02156 [Dictyocaulus viviparus]|uniref:Uncharacterized protein n=1 Tax=Dictyocaulus viviparus TaxID=29172 RepID=A0A0D8Y4H4_DICVI|nr:hypothetical protein DICVIV_02156 [Dictyocaulus viviparus]